MAGRHPHSGRANAIRRSRTPSTVSSDAVPISDIVPITACCGIGQWGTGVTRIRVNVLGPAQVEVDGHVVKLSPRALRVLIRLVAAGGQPVGVKQLRWDLWREVDRPHNARNGRNQVQKGISELRAVLDPGNSGSAAAVLRTERMFSGRDAQSSYRLTLDAGSLDAAEFGTLVDEALHAAAASAADQLTRAVALWRGQPLAEAGDDEYASCAVRVWRAQYLTALRELVRIHCELGRFDLALPVAERLAAEFPDTNEATADLAAVRDGLRRRHGDQLLRRAARREPGGRVQRHIRRRHATGSGDQPREPSGPADRSAVRWRRRRFGP